MKTENKVLLKVLVEKKQKKWIETIAKKERISEAEFVRSIFEEVINFAYSKKKK